MAFLPFPSLPAPKKLLRLRPASQCTLSPHRSSDAVPGDIVAKFYRGALIGAVFAAVAANSIDPANAFGLIKGRLEKCRGDTPCVSTTSVGNPVKFGPPWSYQPQTDNADVAWMALKRAIESSRDNGSIKESIDGPDEYYLRAEFPSSFRGIDDVEFRLIKEDDLVTYRSASREAIFIYPLQTPINTDKNKTRLLDIRQSLGWEEFGGYNLFSTDIK